MRVAWATDVHLDFVRHKKDARTFYDQLTDIDALVITGDITNGQPARFLRAVVDVAKVPVYFVLGNHDYYNSSILKIREEVRELCDVSGYMGEIFYLPNLKQPIPLSDKIGLIGVDGWADGRACDFFKSNVWLHDYTRISEISVSGGNRRKVFEKIRDLGNAEARLLTRKLLDAFTQYQTVVIATHIPPWRCAAWYKDKLSDDHWAPHMVCVAVGKAVTDTVERFPDRRVLMLCGHSHGKGVGKPHPRVISWTGEAVYGHPQVQTVLDVTEDRIETTHPMFGSLAY